MKNARNLLSNARHALNGMAMAALLSMGLIAVAPVAMAQGGSGTVTAGAGIAGQATVYSGSVIGGTNNVGQSNSIAAAQTNGYGTSYQSASNIGSGVGYAGGSIGPSGVTTTNTQYTSSVSQTSGTITGNSPIAAADGSIMNGSSAFGQSTVNTAAAGNYTQSTIGGSLGVSGYKTASYNVKGYGF